MLFYKWKKSCLINALISGFFLVHIPLLWDSGFRGIVGNGEVTLPFLVTQGQN